MNKIGSIVYEAGFLPVLFAEDGCAERVVRAVEKTDIPVIEVLQRSPVAKEELKEMLRIRKSAYIGAGTVCTLEHCKEMVALGVDFIVSPGFNPEMVKWCSENGVMLVPGVSTVSEIMLAYNAGFRIAKFFPFHELGGERVLNGISGPFSDMKFVITGNIGTEAFPYLSNKKIAGIGGVWMFQSENDHTVIGEAEIEKRIQDSLDEAHRHRA